MEKRAWCFVQNVFKYLTELNYHFVTKTTEVFKKGFLSVQSTRVQTQYYFTVIAGMTPKT